MTTPTDAELRELAEKATKGPWTLEESVTRHNDEGIGEVEYYDVKADDDIIAEMVDANSALLIAACSPDRIIALLDGKAAAEGALHFCPTCGESCKDCLCTEQRESALRTSLTRAEAALRELTTLYASADRSVWDDAIDRARAALPAQPKEGETR